MTRRDYILLSGSIRRTWDHANPDDKAGIRTVARDLAYTLSIGNHCFDQPRFLRDCGVEPAKEDEEVA